MIVEMIFKFCVYCYGTRDILSEKGISLHWKQILTANNCHTNNHDKLGLEKNETLCTAFFHKLNLLFPIFNTFVSNEWHEWGVQIGLAECAFLFIVLG